MKEFNGKVDNGDLAYIMECYGEPVAGLPCPIDEKTGKINPNVTQFLLKNGDIKAIFHVKPIYYEHLDGSWRPLSEVLYHQGNRFMTLKEDWDTKMTTSYLAWLMKRASLLNGKIFLPIKSPYYSSPVSLDFSKILFSTLTVYPEPGVTVDGRVRLHTTGTWADVVAAANGNEVDYTSSTINYVFQAFRNSGNGDTYVDRSYFLYDTSALGATVTISAAVMSLFGTGSNDGDTSCYSVMVSSNPATNAALVNADYSAVGSTEFSSQIDNSSWSAVAYNDYTLNASGIAAISKTGVSKFGVRSNKDLSSTAPSSATDNNAACIAAETATTVTDPKLVITYSTVVGPANVKTYNGFASASVKTLNGLALASVKTYNGLA